MQTNTQISEAGAGAGGYEIFAASTGGIDAKQDQAMTVARLMDTFGVADEQQISTWLSGLGPIDALEAVLVVGRGDTGFVYATPPNAEQPMGFFKESLMQALAYFEGANADMG